MSIPGDVPPGESFSEVWKSGAGYNLIPGHPYMITFVVTYADGVTQIESFILIAN